MTQDESYETNPPIHAITCNDAGIPMFWRVPGESLAEALAKIGVVPPLIEMVPEEDIAHVLWILIHSLGTLGCYLVQTDHLTDRELYVALCDRLDRMVEPIDMYRRPGFRGTCPHFFMCGDDEDPTDYLRYYADEDSRQMYLANGLWDGPLPDRRRPPADRDRFLPRVP